MGQFEKRNSLFEKTGLFRDETLLGPIKRNMSPQIAFLSGLITSAKEGSEGAVAMLRSICSNAAQQAPTPDLITIAQCLCQLGIEATRNEASRN